MGYRSFGNQLDDTQNYVASWHMEVRRRQGSGSYRCTELSGLAVGEEMKIYFLIYALKLLRRETVGSLVLHVTIGTVC